MKYIASEMDVVLFQNNDIVTASAVSTPATDTPDPDQLPLD